VKQTIFYVYIYFYNLFINSNKLFSTNKGRHKFKSAVQCKPINKLYQHISSLFLSFIKDEKNKNGIIKTYFSIIFKYKLTCLSKMRF